MKSIQEQYNIKLKENEKIPYNERIEKECHTKNYFYDYKKNRVQKLLENPKDEKVEYYHIKLMREEKEKAERLKQ